MKLTVLVDNNTYIDKYFLGEPAVSYFIEDEGKNILYDVGYSDAFILNAQKLQINLLKLDFLLFSHGHLDHTWGLDPLVKMYMEAYTGNFHPSSPIVICHPRTFLFRPRSWLGGSGFLISEERLSKFFPIKKTKVPVWLTKNLVWLGEISRSNDFESKKPFKKILINGKEEDDFLLDESALAYKSQGGVVVISACSHAGICNIIEQAKKVCRDERVLDVIGGFHLLDPEKNVLEKTVGYFSKLDTQSIHPCHCTDFNSKVALSKVVDIDEVGAGLQLEYP